MDLASDGGWEKKLSAWAEAATYLWLNGWHWEVILDLVSVEEEEYIPAHGAAPEEVIS